MGYFSKITTLIVSVAAALFISRCADRTGSSRIASPPPSRGRVQVDTASGTRKLIDAAGSRAAVILSLHPARLDGAQRLLSRFLVNLPAKLMAPGLEEMLSARDMFAAAGVILRRWLGVSIEWPARLPGWDPARPLVLGLFEPASSDVALAARVLITDPAARLAPGMRHRALIPVTDAAGACAEVKKILEKLGARLKKVDASGTLVFRAWQDYWLAVVPEVDRIRLELVQRPAVFGPPIPTRAAWLRTVLRAPARAAPPQTPALARLYRGDHFLGVHLRPWMLRDLSTHLGAARIARALGRIEDPAMKVQLLAMGLSEAAMGWRLASPRAAEADDLAVVVSADDALRLTASWSLTRLGARALAAGRRAAAAPLTFRPAGEKALLRGWIALDTAAASMSAPPVPLLRQPPSLNELGGLLRDVGHPARAFVWLFRSLGLSRTVNDSREVRRLLGAAPAFGAASFVVEGGDASRPITLAAATVPSAKTGAGDTSDRAARISRLPGVEARAARVGGRQALLISAGLAPDDIFSPRAAPIPDGVVGEVFASGARLAALVMKRDAPAGFALGGIGDAKLRVSLRGRELTGEVLIGRRGAPPPPFARLGGPAVNGSWNPPGQAAVRSAGGRCLERMTEEMIRAFAAMAGASPDMKARLHLEALDGAAGALACAEEDPSTRDVARRLRRIVTRFSAARLGAAWRRDRQLAVLDGACRAGDPGACAAARQIRGAPRITLSRLRSRCPSPYRPDVFDAGLDAAVRIGPAGSVRMGRGAGDLWLSRLLVVDRRARLGAVDDALGRAMSPRARRWRVLFRDEKGALSEARLWLRGKDPDASKDHLLLRLRPDGEVRLTGPSGETTIKRRRCKRGQACPDLDILAVKLRQLYAAHPYSSLYLDLPGGATWDQALPVIVAATCGPGAARLMLGPAPRRPASP